MSAALLIARKDLVQRLRDRTAIILGVIAPAALAAILSFALGSAEDFEIEVLIANEDEGELVDAFIGGLFGGAVTVEEVTDRGAAEAAIGADEAFAAIVIPAGFSADAAAGLPVEVEVLRHPEAPVTAAVAEAMAAGLTGRVATGQLAARAVIAAGGDAAAAAAAAERAVVDPSPVVVVNQAAASISGASVAYFGAAMAVFFLYFTVQFGARSLLNERDTHALQRLLAAPIPRPAILGGKALASVLLGLSSIATVFVITSVALGASYGAVVGVSALSLAVVLAVTATMSAVTALAETPEQADGYGTGVAIVFALIGGNFIDLGDAPAPLRALTKLTPNGWALDGYDELARGGTLGDVAVNLAVLLAIALIVGGAAALRARDLVSA